MLHAGLDLSGKRLDYRLLDERGERVDVGAAPPDAGGLTGLARRVEQRHGPVVVRGAIESMNGARLVHDALERSGWEVDVAGARKVKGLAPLACKTDRIDAWVLGRALPTRPRASDLAARLRAAPRARAGPLASASGPLPQLAQAALEAHRGARARPLPPPTRGGSAP